MKAMIKDILPDGILDIARKFRVKVSVTSLKWAHKSAFFSDLYYLVTGGFSREHQAVLKGRKAYYDSIKKVGITSPLLRRNIHRLEKGMIMRPRRGIFAEGFILETVNCFASAMLSPLLAETEKKWAIDVLDEYFKIVGSSPNIDKARSIYTNLRELQAKEFVQGAEFPSQDGSYKPYAYNVLPSININFDELKRLFIRRRSVRWYQDKPVPLELVRKAANIASFAPTACNRQPYRFLFCNEKSKTIAIAKCAGGTTGFAENLSSIIAVVGDLSAYPFERDRHLIYIDGSLASMQLMLALETLGLSTCSINWPDMNVNEREIKKIIELKDYERIVMLMAVGYADQAGGIPYSQKKENHLILEDIS
ncbi:nitroreductase family protein [Halopseudomonas sp.]|uniref:nitroreductase family protein n=1 Tax=Halopseudomonas sp. TaxID=2901191 RepID=UPI003002B59B